MRRGLRKTTRPVLDGLSAGLGRLAIVIGDVTKGLTATLNVPV
jgi:hypothetical protein